MSDMNQVAATEEEIRQRAFELYEARGGESGHEMEDWFTAEKELNERHRTVAPKTRAARAS